jgi:hypothetical protein
LSGSDTHLHGRHSFVVHYANVTAQLQQLAYNSSISTFGRVHESREALLISFINATFWKAVAPSDAVDDDAHVACEGSEMQVGVPAIPISWCTNCTVKLSKISSLKGSLTWRNEMQMLSMDGKAEGRKTVRQMGDSRKISIFAFSTQMYNGCVLYLSLLLLLASRIAELQEEEETRRWIEGEWRRGCTIHRMTRLHDNKLNNYR